MHHMIVKHKIQARGFTLVEILVVVVIVGILSAMVVPMLSDTSQSKLIAAANQLTADLGYAQIESISHADDLRYVIFDLANHSYQIARIDPDSETTAYIPINNPVGNIDYIVAFGSGPNRQLAGVELSSYSLNGDNQIKFGIYGELDQASNAKITLACDGYQITLTIEPSTGEVSFSEISKVAVEIEE